MGDVNNTIESLAAVEMLSLLKILSTARLHQFDRI